MLEHLLEASRDFVEVFTRLPQRMNDVLEQSLLILGQIRATSYIDPLEHLDPDWVASLVSRFVDLHISVLSDGVIRSQQPDLRPVQLVFLRLYGLVRRYRIDQLNPTSRRYLNSLVLLSKAAAKELRAAKPQSRKGYKT